MPDEALITDLCSICYENKPKYRCPRCQTKTCSLPCSQKHKQRASCNGIRNPAEYIKRSQLATPVGIDRDYNYLKSVERSIDVANRECGDRGVDVAERAATKSLARARHPESILRKYLTDHRIDMRRAPNGMSRQKSNQTRSTKRHMIMWTVEWIDAEGARTTSDSCAASSSIRDLYALKQLENSNVLKRKPGENAREASKRRRKARQAEVEERPSDEGESRLALNMDEAATEPEKELSVAATGFAVLTDTAGSEPASRDDNSNGLATQDNLDPSSRFYLLRPETNAKEKILIPLDRQATLTHCLESRTVLEYPTIYVLPHAPETLPKEYLLETQYLQIQEGEEQELNEAMTKAERKGVFTGIARSEAIMRPVPMDANSILNVLKRDLTR